jgi:acetylornithine/N-succinyldiaminopimelate aminotransferase
MITPVLPSYARFDLAFERGEGAYLWTTGGERFLDMVAGLAVNGLGHAHPVLVNAAQAEKLWHTSNLYRIPGQERLAERLVAASFADTVFFCNSGAEAVECSIKMARIHHHAKGNPERYRLITLEGAFHGRTLAAIAAGGNEKHLNGFGPKVDGFDQVAYGDPAAIAAAIGPQTAGVLLEPVQGEGGVRPASTGYLKALRDLCDAHGILLLFDEVQCGMGRTGKLFAHEWSGVTPDIMAVAKAIGGGFPMGLCLATENAAQGMTAGSHASTYGGNPLACAVGNAVLDVMLADGFMDRVVTAGLYLKQQLAMLRDKHPTIIESVNGEGLMIGIRMKVLNTDMVKALLGEKMLSAAAGDNQVRLLPPLNITDAEMGEAIAAIDRACAKLGAAS